MELLRRSRRYGGDRGLPRASAGQSRGHTTGERGYGIACTMWNNDYEGNIITFNKDASLRKQLFLDRFDQSTKWAGGERRRESAAVSDEDDLCAS